MSGFGVTPTIRVRNMVEALAFYSGPLEFTIEREHEGNSVVKRGDARVMLETDEEFYGEDYNAAIKERLGSPSSISLYIEASDLPGFQGRLQAAGVRIIDPLADRPWGQAEFTVEDHEGNWLSFWAATGAE